VGQIVNLRRIGNPPAELGRASRSKGAFPGGAAPARAEERLRHPAPGGHICSRPALWHSTDALIEQLRLAPAERVSRMHVVCQAAEQARGTARKPK